MNMLNVLIAHLTVMLLAVRQGGHDVIGCEDTNAIGQFRFDC